MASDNEPGETPWYRSTAATFTAGGIGAILVAGLVVTVVQMSDEWSKPQTTVLTTAVRTTPPTGSRDKQPFVITPSDSYTTTFTTSVPLSTTDIGNPPDTTTSDTTTSETSGDATTSETTPTSTTRELPTTFPSQRRPGDDEHSETTRNRPRYNQTRTYSPG